MKSQTKQASVVQSIDSFLAQVNDSTRRLKEAEAKSEAGGYEGETTHPVKSVDDRLRDATEGARSSENTKDVKEQEGSISVDSTSESINKGQDEAQLNLGTRQSATGEDPSSETESAKGGKEDGSQGDHGSQGRGKTTHPARTDNDSLEGGKYAAAARLLTLIKAAEDPGRDLVARIAVEAQGMVQKQAQTLAQGNKSAAAQPAAQAAPQAAAAGHDLASMLGGLPMAEKQAVEQSVVADIAHTVQDARNMAVKSAQFLNQLFTELQQKEAAGNPPPPPPEHGGDGGGADAGAAGMAGAGAPPPGQVPGADEAAQGMGPGGGGGDEEALIEALLGGGHGGEGGMGGGADGGAGGGEGGMPPGAGDMAGGPGGGGEGMHLSPEDIAMLEHILQQQGVKPEELEAGATAKAAHLLVERQKYAAAKPQANWRPKNAEEAQRYQAITNYIKELTGR